MKELDKEYSQLIDQIGLLLESGRRQAAQAVNSVLVNTYWLVGSHIMEFEQNGKERAEYGQFLLERLSRDLTLKFGKGFSRSNFIYMRKLYLHFPKRETLSNVYCTFLINKNWLMN